MRRSYQVVGACAMFTTTTPNGPTKLMYYRGAFVPPDVPQREIDHHLSVGLIAAVDDPYNSPVDGNGNDLLPEVPAGSDGPEGQDAAELTSPDPTEPAKPAKRAPAKKTTAKPAEDPDLADLRTRAVAAGMDPGEVEKASTDDLRAALAG